MGADIVDGVAEEQGVSCWSVDCSVEDVADDFSLLDWSVLFSSFRYMLLAI